MKSKYSKEPVGVRTNGVVAISSIYDIDILEDNVIQCQERLFSIFNNLYTSLYKDNCKKSCTDSIRFILGRNILLGDALSLKTVGNKPEPIVFSEWSLVTGSQIKRRDYTFADLISSEGANVGLFSTGMSDSGTPFFMPTPVKEFPLCNFFEVHYEKAN